MALAWRYRHGVGSLSAILALVVSIKLFLWLLLAWTLSTRRFRASVFAAAVGASVTFAAWAAIGFAGFRSYPNLRNELGNEASYSIVAVSEKFGYGERAGDATTAVLGGLLLGLVLHYARRGDDLRAFTCALGAALALSPSLWQHYLVLVVPVALARPRFSSLWLGPIVLCVCLRAANGEGVQTVLPLLLTAPVLSVVVRPVRTSVAAEATS